MNTTEGFNGKKKCGWADLLLKHLKGNAVKKIWIW